MLFTIRLFHLSSTLNNYVLIFKMSGLGYICEHIKIYEVEHLNITRREAVSCPFNRQRPVRTSIMLIGKLVQVCLDRKASWIDGTPG